MKLRLVLLLAGLLLMPLCGRACAPLNNPCGIYDFRGYVTGGLPQGGVVLGPDGILYGETVNGGTKPCKATYGNSGLGCGTVYSISPTGGFKVLVSFHGPNGAFGASTLTLIGNTLYGTTERDGSGQNGVIFSVNTDGSNPYVTGEAPASGPILAPDGTLYGTNSTGIGLIPGGILYSYSPNDPEILNAVCIFGTGNAGVCPYPQPILAPNGDLIGTTYYNGTKHIEVSGAIYDCTP